MIGRVRMILVLGYWVLGDIHRYWIVLGDIFFVVTPNMIPIRQQSVHVLSTIIVIIILERWYSVVYISLQYQYIAVLHSSISIGTGYWHR